MKRIVIGDKSWVYEFDMQTRQQASDRWPPTEAKSTKPSLNLSKDMFSIFFDYRGVVHS